MFLVICSLDITRTSDNYGTRIYNWTTDHYRPIS